VPISLFPFSAFLEEGLSPLIVSDVVFFLRG